ILPLSPSSVEVGMGGPDETLTRGALGGRHVAHERRPRRPQQFHRLRSDVAIEELLDLENPATLDHQADRDERRAPFAVEHGLQADLAEDRIGDVNLERSRLDSGLPEDALAK